MGSTLMSEPDKPQHQSAPEEFKPRQPAAPVPSLDHEHHLVMQAKAWITDKAGEVPALHQYLDNWGDWDAWP